MNAITIINDTCRIRATIPEVDWTVSFTREEQEEILEIIRNFDSFGPEDFDLFWEHDYGVFEYKGKQLAWRIDYFSPEWEYYDEKCKAFRPKANIADPRTDRLISIVQVGE